jgi:hypothetical protein
MHLHGDTGRQWLFDVQCLAPVQRLATAVWFKIADISIMNHLRFWVMDIPEDCQ